MVTFPLVVVDLSQAPKSLVAVTMERAHDVVVVSTRLCLRCALRVVFPRD